MAWRPFRAFPTFLRRPSVGTITDELRHFPRNENNMTQRQKHIQVEGRIFLEATHGARWYGLQYRSPFHEVSGFWQNLSAACTRSDNFCSPCELAWDGREYSVTITVTYKRTVDVNTQLYVERTRDVCLHTHTNKKDTLNVTDIPTLSLSLTCLRPVFGAEEQAHVKLSQECLVSIHEGLKHSRLLLGKTGRRSTDCGLSHPVSQESLEPFRSNSCLGTSKGGHSVTLVIRATCNKGYRTCNEKLHHGYLGFRVCYMGSYNDGSARQVQQLTEKPSMCSTSAALVTAFRHLFAASAQQYQQDKHSQSPC